MKTRNKKQRRLAAFIILVAIVAWIGGCTAGSSFGLSAIIPSKDKGSEIVGEHVLGGTGGEGANGKGSGAISGGNGNNGTQGSGSNGNTATGNIDTGTGNTGTGNTGTGNTGTGNTSTGNTGTGNTSTGSIDTDHNGNTSSGGDDGGKDNGQGKENNNEHANNAGKGDNSTSGGSQDGKGNVDEHKQGNGNGTAVKPDSNEKLVALTFDDGPDTKYTTAVLDILKEKGVKATFFVVGMQVEKYPDVMKRMVEEGHAIGNHSQSHKDLSKLSRAGILSQIKDADDAIEAALGWTPTLFRAPYGALSDTLKTVMKEQDRRLVGWTVDTRDWAGTSVKDMRAMIRKETKPNGIILMHSFGGKHIKNTVEMLPHVIDDLHKLGFTMVTVDQIPE